MPETHGSPTGGVSITLQGRERVLRFTNEALEVLEDQCGLALIDLMEKLRWVSIVTLRDAIWVGLLHEEPTLRRADVLKMVDLTRVKEQASAISKALAAVFGDQQEVGDVTGGGTGEGKA